MEHIPSIIQALPVLLKSMNENRFGAYMLLVMFIVAAGVVVAWIKR